MKDDILYGVSEVKKAWGQFTVIGKVTLFPLLLIVMVLVGGMMLIFVAVNEGVDECWAAFKRVNAKIFLK